MSFKTLPASVLRDAQLKRGAEMDAYKGAAPEVRTVEDMRITIFGGRLMWNGVKRDFKSEFLGRFTELPRLEDFSSDPETLAKQFKVVSLVSAEILRACIIWDMERTPLEMGCKSAPTMATAEEAALIADVLYKRFADEFLLLLRYDVQGLCEFSCAQVIDWVTEASADLTDADFAPNFGQRMAA